MEGLEVGRKECRDLLTYQSVTSYKAVRCLTEPSEPDRSGVGWAWVARGHVGCPKAIASC